MIAKPVILLGGGGHAKVCIDVLNKQSRKIIGFVSPDENSETVLGVAHLGDDDLVLNYSPDDVELVNAIGFLPKSSVRQVCYERFKQKAYTFVTLVHSSAIIAEEVILKEGAQVMAGTVIQPGVIVGENSIINTRVSVDHDCNLGSNCHIAPGSVLCGNVVLGEGVFVGSGAVIIQNIHVPADSIIAAGETVRKNVSALSDKQKVGIQ
jgi:sugar O-acyltransferase (sialic acid O-acetyltransferase NeuD family)